MKKVIKWICIFLVSALVEVFVFSAVAELNNMIVNGEIEDIVDNAMSDVGVYDGTGVLEGYSEDLEYKLISDSEYAVCGGGSGDVKISPIYNGKSVTRIEASAFKGNTDIKSVELPYSVTEIGAYAFSGCYGLKKVSMNGVKLIGTRAFGECLNLSQVDFGNSLETLRDEAFVSCHSLKTVNLPDTTKTIGVGCFYDCTSLSAVSLGNGIEYIDRNAFYGSVIEEITLPGSLTFVHDMALNNCSELKKIECLFAEGAVEGAPWYASCTVTYTVKN